MKVVYLMDQMYLHGGAEKIVSLKINALVNNFKQDLFLITTEQKNKKNVYNISSKVHQIDLDVNYNRSKSYFSLKNLLKTSVHFFKLKRELAKIKPDVIISVSQTPEQFFLPFIRKKTPKIKEFHSSGVNFSKPTSIIEKLKNRLFLIYKRYNTLVVLNEDEKQYYPFKNLKVIPNFIYLNENKTFEKVERKKIIISAGRMAAVKQFGHLIEAWNLIENSFPDWKVCIYGDGDNYLSSELEELINNYKLKNIFLKGATLSLNEKMKEASIFALTSSTECFPMVLLESLANGLPIVSYNCPHGPQNIITNGEDGILVEHNNVKVLAKELSKLINDYTRRERMGLNALENVKRFNERIVMKKWITLFNANYAKEYNS